jgi:hypothetical protein
MISRGLMALSSRSSYLDAHIKQGGFKYDMVP